MACSEGKKRKENWQHIGCTLNWKQILGNLIVSVSPGCWFESSWFIRLENPKMPDENKNVICIPKQIIYFMWGCVMNRCSQHSWHSCIIYLDCFSLISDWITILKNDSYLPWLFLLNIHANYDSEEWFWNGMGSKNKFQTVLT